MSDLSLKTSTGQELKGKEIDLKNLFNVIKKRLWIIILITSLFTVLSGLYSHYTFSPIYQASSRIMVKANGEIMNTILVLMKDSSTLEKVVEDLNINRSPESLSGQISVEPISGSQVIRISVIDSDPVLAAKIANATMDAYKSEIPKRVNFNDFEILANAKENPNASPINDNFMRNIILGLFGGLVLSVGFVFVLDSLDDSVRSEKELEKSLGIPVLGTISKVNRRKMVRKMDDPDKFALGGGSRWHLVKDNLLKFLKIGA